MIKIDTKRCVVRQFLEKDIDAFMIYRNNETWMEHQGFKGLSKSGYKDALLDKYTSLDEGMQLAIILKVNNELIGDIYLHKCEDAFWIGYTISPTHARQGYAYEVVMGTIEWIKDQGVTTIYAGVLAENIASVQLLKKIGFNYTETDEDGEDIYLLSI